MKPRSSIGQFVRAVHLDRKAAAARLGEHEEASMEASPAPTLSPEELAQGLARDPEFVAWARAELAVDMLRRAR